MVSIEKELADLLEDVYYNAPYELDEFMETAKRIIAKYPQILAKKVLSGEARSIAKGTWVSLIENISPEKTTVEIFIREVK